MDFVRNVLAHVPREHLVVLSMHIPLRCYLDPDNPADTTADSRALLEVLGGRPHTVSFAGHLHATEHHYLHGEAGFAGPHPHHHHVLTAASGSWWSGPVDHRGIPAADSTDGTPNGFHVLSVSGHRYTTRLVPSVAKPAARLRVLLDGRHRSPAADMPARPGTATRGLSIPEGDLRQGRVIVNVFDGGPRTRVSCAIVGRSHPAPMQRVAMPDPLMRDLFAGDTRRKAWVQAVPSSHIWQAPLPMDLPSGAHVLDIRVMDEYGREHAARTVIEVTRRSGMPSASL
ncbi:MAG: calcineurin-like phosphoesterase C-terminal domain-containing protein [Hyphomonadaceae bacterium]|nr:calcineurin-like phosphoesterase C-terminal domain-containing protein [Hyphomonadaceae bacterium]